MRITLTDSLGGELIYVYGRISAVI